MKCTDCNKQIKKYSNAFHLCAICFRKFEKKWIAESFAYADANTHS